MNYGTSEWFEQQYSKVRIDPWGLSWRPSQKLRYIRTLELIQKISKPIRLVLDIGCGTGDFSALIKENVRGSRVVGIDFAEAAVHRARERHADMEFETLSLEQIGRKWRDQADLVVCLEVLYYLSISDRSSALESLSAALRPGGYAVFSSLIGAPPYFIPRTLKALVSTQFEVISMALVYAKGLSILEKLPLKIDHAVRNRLPALPFRVFTKRPKRSTAKNSDIVLTTIEKFLKSFGTKSLSHALILARKTSRETDA